MARPGRPERNRAARSFRQLRRFHHVINSDKVLGTHSGDLEAEIAKERAANHFTYAELEENDVDLKKLRGWFEKIRKLDFYRAELATEAEERLHACKVWLDAYARQVFDAHDENQ